MRFLFVVDPLADLVPEHDTSIVLMEAVQRLGMEAWVAGPSDLAIAREQVTAWARRAHVVPSQHRADPRAWWRASEEQRMVLGAGDAVLMRVDPPVDGAYLRATFLLDAAARAGAFVVNDPRGLREANEKLLSLAVGDLAPDTIVTGHAVDIREALGRWDTAVAKPLDGIGGRDVVLLRAGDPGLTALIDLVTRRGTRQVVLQEYLAGVAEGDKRIFLLDGEPIGAINRRAPDGEFRCNMALGATVEGTSVGSSELEICRRLRPQLRRWGLAFVGIDVIDGRLTEVNVTSPTGLREVERLSGSRPSDQVIQWMVDRSQ